MLITGAGNILSPCTALCVLAMTPGGRELGKMLRSTHAFFHGHDDNVTAAALDSTRTRAAAGQTGSVLYVCVWDTTR